MKKNLLNYGLLSLICVLSCLAGKAQADTSDDYGTLLWHTNFTDVEELDRRTAYGDGREFVKENGDHFTMVFYGVGIYPDSSNDKFPEYTGWMEIAKYPSEFNPVDSLEMPDTKPYAYTAESFNYIKTIVFKQIATGTGRGIKISVKGDGDDDWVPLWDKNIEDSENCQNTSNGGREATDVLEVNRTNCQIKFESVNLEQNAFLKEISVYGETTPDGGYPLTFDPEDGAKVTSLSQITVSCEDGISLPMSAFYTAVVTNDKGVQVAESNGASGEGGTSCTIYFDNEITAPSTYTVTIPEGFFLIGPNEEKSDGMSLTYIISGGESGYEFTFVPEDGSKVKGDVDEIQILINNGCMTINDWEEAIWDPIEIKDQDGNVAATFTLEEWFGAFPIQDDEWNTIGYECALSQTISDPGTYTYTIPANAFWVGTDWAAMDDYSEEMTVTFTIAGETAYDFTFVPDNGESFDGVVDYIGIKVNNGFIKTNDKETAISVPIEIKDLEGNVAATFSLVDKSGIWEITNDDDETIGYEYDLSSNIDRVGTYTYTIPANAFCLGTDLDDLSDLSEEMTVQFTILPHEYDFTFVPNDSDTVTGPVNEIQITVEGSSCMTINQGEEALWDPIEIKDQNGSVAATFRLEEFHGAWPILDNDDNTTGYVCSLSKAISALGTYTYTIPANAFWLGDWTDMSDLSKEMTVQFTIDGTTEYELTFTPADGEIVEGPVSELTIIVNDEMEANWDEFDETELVVKNAETGEVVTGVPEDGFENLIEYDENGYEVRQYGYTFTLEKEISEPGTYTYTYPEHAFFLGEDDAYMTDEMTITFKITGESDGIKSAIMDADGTDRYYNINGQRVTTPHEGIYILNGKKVVVK